MRHIIKLTTHLNYVIMKKTTIISVIFSIAILQMTACVNINANSGIFKNIKGNGVLKEQDRGKMDYNAVSVGGSIDLIIADVADAPIKVSGDENLVDAVEVYVKDGVLNAHLKKDFGGYTSKLGLKVTVPNNGRIKEITASGSSDVYTESVVVADNMSITCRGSSDFKGSIKAKECELNFSGSSDFKGSVEAETINVKCSGSSDCIINGKADFCKITTSGSSDFKGFDFIVNKLDCDTSGSSDIQITCNGEMKVRARGSSDVYYKGDAKIIESHSSGSSDIIKR